MAVSLSFQHTLDCASAQRCQVFKTHVQTGRKRKDVKNGMEREQIVRATFKSKHRKQLNAIIGALRKAFGKENINTLSPIFIYKSQLYVLDMDIRIPDALLRYAHTPSSNEREEES